MTRGAAALGRGVWGAAIGASGGGSVGALVLGPAPNMFATTAARDTAGTTVTYTQGTAYGTWTVIGGRPASGQVQFNESLRRVAFSVIDSSGSSHSNLFHWTDDDTLNGQRFRLRVDASNFADFTIGQPSARSTVGGIEWIEYTIEAGSIDETGSLSVNSSATFHPLTGSGGADWLAEYDNNSQYAVLETTSNPDKAYVRRNGAWVEVVGSLLRGQLTNPQNSDVDARIASWARAFSPSGQIPDGTIPAAIMRDAELTAAAIRNLLGLTATEVNDLLTGATLNGNVLTFTQNDGTTVALTIPSTGGGTSDGVVSSGAFNAEGTTLTLTLSTGGTVDVSVPGLLRSSLPGASLNAATISSLQTFNTLVATVNTRRTFVRSTATFTMVPHSGIREISGAAITQVFADDLFFWNAGNARYERLGNGGRSTGGGGITVTNWTSGTAYARGSIVTHSSTLWIQYGAATRTSTATPPADPTHWWRLGRVQDWESGSSYRSGDVVVGSDDRLYVCITDGANIATNPTGTSNDWFLFNPVRQGQAWNNTRAYARGDIVFQASKLWMCMATTSTGTDPNGSGQTHWVEVGGGSTGGGDGVGLLRDAVQPQTVKRTATTDLDVAAPTDLTAGVGTTITLDALDSGSILSGLDSTEESVVIKPGVYIIEAYFKGVKNAVTSARSSVGFIVQQKEADDTWTTIATSAPIYVRGVAAVTDELEFLRPEARFGVTVNTTIRVQAVSLPFWGIPAVPPIAWSFQEVDITVYAIGGLQGESAQPGVGRGDLLASSPLPTAVINSGSVANTLAFTVASGVTWVEHLNNSTDHILKLNQTSKPASAIGFEVVAKVNGVEFDSTRLIETQTTQTGSAARRLLRFEGSGGRLFVALGLRSGAVDDVTITFIGSGANFPANSTIEIYELVVKGPKGDPINVPDAPANTAFRRYYGLEVPVTGDAKWTELEVAARMIATLRGGVASSTADTAPTAAKLSVVGSNGEVVIPAHVGRRIFIAQLTSEEDINNIERATAPGVNQISGFTKVSGTTTVDSASYDVWVETNPSTSTSAETWRAWRA